MFLRLKHEPDLPRQVIEDRRVSVCTDCGWGIFTNHNYHWTTRGLVHVDCNEKRIILVHK